MKTEVILAKLIGSLQETHIKSKENTKALEHDNQLLKEHLEIIGAEVHKGSDNQTKALAVENSELKQQLADIKAESLHELERLRALESENQILKKKVSSLKTESASDLERVKSLETENTTIKTRLSTLELDSRSDIEKRKALEEDNQLLKHQLALTQSESLGHLEQVKAAASASEHALTAEIAALERELELQRQTVYALPALPSQPNLSSRKNDVLKQEAYTTAMNQIQVLKKQHSQTLRHISESLQELSDLLQSAMTELFVLVKEKTTTESSNFQETIVAARTMLTDTQNEMGTLKVQFESLKLDAEREEAAAEKTIQELQTQIHSLELQLSNKTRECATDSTNSAKIEELTELLDQYSEMNSVLQNDIANAQHNLSETTQALTMEIDHLKKSISEHKAANVSLRTETEQLHKTINQYIQTTANLENTCNQLTSRNMALESDELDLRRQLQRLLGQPDESDSIPISQIIADLETTLQNFQSTTLQLRLEQESLEMQLAASEASPSPTPSSPIQHPIPHHAPSKILQEPIIPFPKETQPRHRPSTKPTHPHTRSPSTTTHSSMDAAVARSKVPSMTPIPQKEHPSHCTSTLEDVQLEPDNRFGRVRITSRIPVHADLNARVENDPLDGLKTMVPDSVAFQKEYGVREKESVFRVPTNRIEKQLSNYLFRIHLHHLITVFIIFLPLSLFNLFEVDIPHIWRTTSQLVAFLSALILLTRPKAALRHFQ
ncbi:hypothetical protein HDU79_010122 [Rhizoclosmatium sp. JEL0117]|nr:hypothetical protein HDU79_010122 [Rhizoclosmatium sp. JEL0117]